MESGIRVFLLSAALALGGCASIHHLFHRHGDEGAPPSADASESATQASEEDADSNPPRVIEPQVERRKIKVPQIHSHNWELGLQYGALTIENFGTNPVYGLMGAYHITEDFFLQGSFGRSKGGLTSFETLSNINLLTPSERYYTYYDLALGYNFLPGEVFIGRKLAMTSSFYLLAGIGDTDFAGDNKFTVSFGGGYRVLPTDWLAVHVSVEDHVFQSDLLGVDKLTNNLEADLGVSVFF
jgi:outer membrane beta-barrel protein